MAAATPPDALAAPRVALRPWRRRTDRSAIARWPQSELPPHWGLVASSAGPRVSFAVDLVAEPRLIGRITLREITAASARLGTYLHPAYTSQGFGTEALLLFCAHADEVLQLRRLVLDVAVDNERAIRCYRHCRFETVATVTRSGFAFLEMERHASSPTVSVGPAAGLCAA